MAEFASVRTVADFRRLDDGEILEGYLNGFHGSSEPGSDHSRAFWHGWRNGRVDAGLAEPDCAQLSLDQEFRLMTRFVEFPTNQSLVN
jgi:hypothetical protein